MKKELPQYVKKYIDKFGISGWEIFKGEDKCYKQIIVIPAVQEFENIKKLIASLSQNENTYFSKTLILFSINSIENASSEVVNENQNTIDYLTSLIKQNSILNIALVDINSPGKQMPEKEGGVGLARKIAMDLALIEFDYADHSKNILVCLDADCEVENNYIGEIYKYFNDKKCSAAYVQFEHMLSGNRSNDLAIICYEMFLRYYVLGLQYADSPYAFHTIGSTMACDTETYVKIQGMNKKKAAEDFYFMEKLSKNVEIEKIDGTKVFPSSRSSWRVPFGTGRSVMRYLAEERDEYLLYSPKSFYILKEWVNYYHSSSVLSAEEYLRAAKSIHDELFNFLIQNNFEASWQKIVNNSNSDVQINIQKKYWFDGFRTLKLIHHLRDKAHPLINMFDALDEMFENLGSERIERFGKEIPSFENQLKYLNLLRELA